MINTISRRKIRWIAIACTLFCLGNAQAVTMALNGGSGYALINSGCSVGTIINNPQGLGGQVERDVIMTNYLLSIANGGFGIIGGEEYQRSSNFANPLPAATAAGAIATSSGGLAFGTNAMGAIVSLTLPGTFQYLLVAYDGPNGGAIVYNIADLAAGTVIELARNAEPHDIGDGIASQVLIESSRYQMTGWTLLNPTQTTVPEGGLTLMMLGSGLSGLAVLRRFLKP